MNRVTLTLPIPADAELVLIAEPEPSYRSSNPQQTLRYSRGVSLPSGRRSTLLDPWLLSNAVE